jgi:cell wall-associated NlpC family hydrolase
MFRRAMVVWLGLLVCPALASEGIEGVYRLQGEPQTGGRYTGEVRIHRDGDEYVLSTTFDDARTRGQARASVLADAGGKWRFVVSGGGAGEPTRGARGTLDDMFGDDSAEPGSGSLILEVVDREHCLLGRLTRDGALVARERMIPRDVDAGGQVGLTVIQPRLDRFSPHRPDGPNAVTVRYHLEPRGASFLVRVAVVDREGQVVYRDSHDDVRDDGAGVELSWDGSLSSGRGYADARRSPYRVQLTAEREGASDDDLEPPARGEAQVVVVPVVDAAWVVSRAGDEGPLTSDGKIVAHDDRPLITGVVRAIVGGVRASERGRTDRAYFVVSQRADGQVVRVQGLGSLSVSLWDASRWGQLELHWETVQPLGLHSSAYRATQNARRMTRHGEYTNVVSNGDQEGEWLGRDVIEYQHSSAGVGSEPASSDEPGTLRYRFDVDYSLPHLRLGAEARPGTFGRRDRASRTTAEAARSGLLAADYSRQLGGISNRVHRISRRGASSNLLLSYLECYRGVPWLYGSLGPQTQHFIGYDCADLAFGAARHAGLTRRTRFTNADNLCKLYTRSRAGHGILRWDSEGRTVEAGTGDLHPVEIGGADTAKVQAGDIVFWDWDGDGRWDHTTVLWSNTSGTLDLDTQLVWAHHENGSTDGFYVGAIRELSHPASRDVVRMQIRRF